MTLASRSRAARARAARSGHPCDEHPEPSGSGCNSCIECSAHPLRRCIHPHPWRPISGSSWSKGFAKGRPSAPRGVTPLIPFTYLERFPHLAACRAWHRRRRPCQGTLVPLRSRTGPDPKAVRTAAPCVIHHLRTSLRAHSPDTSPLVDGTPRVRAAGCDPEQRIVPTDRATGPARRHCPRRLPADGVYWIPWQDPCWPPARASDGRAGPVGAGESEAPAARTVHAFRQPMACAGASELGGGAGPVYRPESSAARPSRWRDSFPA